MTYNIAVIDYCSNVNEKEHEWYRTIEYERRNDQTRIRPIDYNTIDNVGDFTIKYNNTNDNSLNSLTTNIYLLLDDSCEYSNYNDKFINNSNNKGEFKFNINTVNNSIYNIYNCTGKSVKLQMDENVKINYYNINNIHGYNYMLDFIKNNYLPELNNYSPKLIKIMQFIKNKNLKNKDFQQKNDINFSSDSGIIGYERKENADLTNSSLNVKNFNSPVAIINLNNNNNKLNIDQTPLIKVFNCNNQDYKNCIENHLNSCKNEKNCKKSINNKIYIPSIDVQNSVIRNGFFDNTSKLFRINS